MKTFIFSLSVVCLLAFAGQSQAFGFGFGRAIFVQPAPLIIQQQAFVPLAQVRGNVGVIQAAPAAPVAFIQRTPVIRVAPQPVIVVRQPVVRIR